MLPGRPQQEQTEVGKWTANGDELELVAPDHRVSCKVRPDGLECKSDAFLSHIAEGFSSAIHFKKLRKR